MNKPRICAVITDNDLPAIRGIETLADLFEVRIDLIGKGWQKLAGQLKKPWIACNRRREEGGSWQGNESERIKELLRATELGAGIIDIELETRGLEETIKSIKKKAKCLISYHDLQGTPALDSMKEIIKRELKAGADICKLVTTARKFADNLSVLQLIAEFPETRMVSFAMGPSGSISRILCPLVGGDFTYASIGEGQESAPGQITVRDLNKIYGMLRDEK